MRLTLLLIVLIGLSGVANGEPPTPLSISSAPADSQSNRVASPVPVSSETESQDAANRGLLARKLDEMKVLQTEIRHLREATHTSAQEQLMLRLMMVEINRTKMSELGVGLDELFGATKGLSEEMLERPLGPVSKPAFGWTFGEKELLAVVVMLQQKGLAKILAQPRLVVTSGAPAFYNAGGEIPVPAEGDKPFRYHPYGTQVDCSADIQQDDVIHLQIKARVSELDDSHQVKVANVLIPGIRERRIDTTIDAKSGQIVILGGQVETRTSRLVRRAPKGGQKIEDIEAEVQLLVLVKVDRVTSDRMAEHAVIEPLKAGETVPLVPHASLDLPSASNRKN